MTSSELYLLFFEESLKDVTINCHIRYPWHDAGKRVARGLFQDACRWLEAVGLAKGKRDAVLDILHLGPGCFTDHRMSLIPDEEAEDIRNTRKKDCVAELRNLLE